MAPFFRRGECACELELFDLYVGTDIDEADGVLRHMEEFGHAIDDPSRMSYPSINKLKSSIK